MKKVLFIFCAMAFIYSSCTKDEADLSAEIKTEYQNDRMAPAAHDLKFDDNLEGKIKLPPCPEPVDYACCGIYELLDDMTGTGSFGETKNGKLDKLLNCPFLAAEYCERACSNVTKTFGYQDGWIAEWHEDFEPCSPDGWFTAAEQQAILDEIKARALAEAPLCNGQPMEPVSYNVFWDTISFTWFYIGVHVTYQAPCVFTPTLCC